MPTIKKKLIVNEKNRPVGVVLDLRTFKQMEEIVEDYLFGKILQELDDEKPMSLEEGMKYYAKLKKRK